MLDGDIDPMWIESLNTVMDDNKVILMEYVFYDIQIVLYFSELGVNCFCIKLQFKCNRA